MQTQKFDKPLNEWTEEAVDVATIEPVLDRNGKVINLKRSTRQVLQKTIYTQASDPETIDCGRGNHNWYIPDKHNHVAFCKNKDCKKRRFIRAVYEKVVDGKIFDRDDINNKNPLD